MERFTGKVDPHRATREEDRKDVYGFAKFARGGPPSHEGVTVDEYCFWLGKIIDLHLPIIHTFGRYPYRNAATGRESTEAEKEFLEATNHFAEEGEEVAWKVRRDVLEGRWTPLGEDRDE